MKNTEPMVVKKVSFPLEVVVCGTKTSLKNVEDALRDKLNATLPLVLRLGRGAKDTIIVRRKDPK